MTKNQDSNKFLKLKTKPFEIFILYFSCKNGKKTIISFERISICENTHQKQENYENTSAGIITFLILKEEIISFSFLAQLNLRRTQLSMSLQEHCRERALLVCQDHL